MYNLRKFLKFKFKYFKFWNLIKLQQILNIFTKFHNFFKYLLN